MKINGFGLGLQQLYEPTQNDRYDRHDIKTTYCLKLLNIKVQQDYDDIVKHKLFECHNCIKFFKHEMEKCDGFLYNENKYHVDQMTEKFFEIYSMNQFPKTKKNRFWDNIWSFNNWF